MNKESKLIDILFNYGFHKERIDLIIHNTNAKVLIAEYPATEYPTELINILRHYGFNIEAYFDENRRAIGTYDLYLLRDIKDHLDHEKDTCENKLLEFRNKFNELFIEAARNGVQFKQMPCYNNSGDLYFRLDITGDTTGQKYLVNSTISKMILNSVRRFLK